MITRLSGKVVEKEATRLVVEVGGGLALECKTSLKSSNRFGAPGEAALVYTVFVLTGGNMAPIVPVLYGFYDPQERQMFELLLSVNRLGASKVLAALFTFSPKELASAIETEDTKTLSAIKGVGAKQAERIILDVREKIQQLEFGQSHQETKQGQAGNALVSEAVSALEALGFVRKTAEKQIKDIMAEQEGPFMVEELVREALMRS